MPSSAGVVGGMASADSLSLSQQAVSVKAAYSTALAFLLSYGCPKTVIVNDLHKVLPITLAALTTIANKSQEGGGGGHGMSPRTEQDGIFSTLETLSILLDEASVHVCDHLGTLIPALLHLGAHYKQAMVCHCLPDVLPFLLPVYLSLS